MAALHVGGLFAEVSSSGAYSRHVGMTHVKASRDFFDSINGQDARSYMLLDNELKQAADENSSLKAWALTLLAEMAERQGNLAGAEQHFRQALELDPSGTYLLGAYADFLLDRNRSSEVALLQKHTRVDGLLLRYALALKGRGSAEAARPIDDLQSRFAAPALRGD